MTVLAYLWQRDQSELLDEMAVVGLHASIIKVAGAGLNLTHLGANVTDESTRAILERLRLRFGLHPCGEGGEYETYTTACPLFASDIDMFVRGVSSLRSRDSRSSEKVLMSDARQADPYSIVAHLRITDAGLVPRPETSASLNCPAPALFDVAASNLALRIANVRLRPSREADSHTACARSRCAGPAADNAD